MTPYLTEELALEATSSNLGKRKQPALRLSPRKRFRAEEYIPEPEPEEEIQRSEKEEEVDWKAKYLELVAENNILKEEK